MDRSKILPLRGINLQSKPAVKRAIAWSCDAELAVAADDSVHVFPPQFPDPEPNGTDDGKGGAQNGGNDDAMDEDGDQGRLVDNIALDPRQQFFDGSRQFPVTYPPLNPLINRHVWDAADLPFPSVAETSAGSYDPDDGGEFDDEHDSGVVDNNIRTGAGVSFIASVGSTMNHVVAIDWSPSGVGRNRRTVLGVLTASGVLAIYGDGGQSFGSGARNAGQGSERDLTSWVVLWAVGERFVIPGQDEYGERIVAFAWSKEVGPGKALLAYMNDERELVVVSVCSEFRKDDTDSEDSIWNVVEVARMKMEGPHPDIDQWDSDYVPGLSCLCLRWSPWHKEQDSWTCVLSYMDRNYVGFRRVSLEIGPQPSSSLQADMEDHDWDGKCLFLAPDAFLEFEDTVWSVGQHSVCRGVIATPFQAVTFQISFGERNVLKPWLKHDLSKCKTAYRSADDFSHNPIMGLVIHPASMATSPSTPSYTLVRLSATATNNDWYETNAQFPSVPQWSTEIAQRVGVSTPANMRDPDQASDDEDDDDAADDDNDEDDDEDEDGLNASGPDVFPHRMLIWGLASSPGGGSTAVLATHQTTQHPERGGWHNSRSRIMFGFQATGASIISEQQLWEHVHEAGNLTTEGRLWEWMYGGGAGVPGITSLPAEGEVQGPDREADESRRKVRELFSAIRASQKCEFCSAGIKVGSKESGCENGHVFDTCGASGLAIQEPGISRVCGACRSRCLNVAELIKVLPNEAELIRHEVSGEVCMRCGGKYND